MNTTRNREDEELRVNLEMRLETFALLMAAIDILVGLMLYYVPNPVITVALLPAFMIATPLLTFGLIVLGVYHLLRAIQKLRRRRLRS